MIEFIELYYKFGKHKSGHNEHNYRLENLNYGHCCFWPDFWIMKSQNNFKCKGFRRKKINCRIDSLNFSNINF